MSIELSRFKLSRVIPAIERRFKEQPFTNAWYNSEQGKNNCSYLESIHNKYKNERLYLIANGPSIKNMDLSVLKDKYTMCMNRFYIYFDKIGFVPNFLTCIEETVLEQFKDDLASLPCETFFNWRFHKSFPNSHFLKEAYSFNPSFQKDLVHGAHFGGTVTYASLQLAYYMGFKEVVLVGLDHSFKEKGTPSTIEVRHYENDESHFDPNYFPKGMKWKLPDLQKSEYSYALARKYYEEDGRKILDATVGGKCKIFEKVNFNKVI